MWKRLRLQYFILSLNDPMCFKTSITNTKPQNQFSINKQQVNLAVKPLPVQSRGSDLLKVVFIAERHSPRLIFSFVLSLL